MSDLKINGYQPIHPVQKMNASVPAEHVQKAPDQGDKIEISAEAKQMQDVHRFEEIRKEKIDRIKAKIDAGTYSVSAEQVAARLYAYWNQKQ